MISLTRRYRFPAAHVLCHPDYSPAENLRVFGKCANPAGHGHDYGIEVTVTGPVDPHSGRVIEPERLDEIFAQRVGERLGHRMLNDDELFQQRVPTAENIAQVIHERLEEPVSRCGAARVLRVRVVETRRNSFIYGEPE